MPKIPIEISPDMLDTVAAQIVTAQKREITRLKNQLRTRDAQLARTRGGMDASASIRAEIQDVATRLVALLQNAGWTEWDEQP